MNAAPKQKLAARLLTRMSLGKRRHQPGTEPQSQSWAQVVPNYEALPQAYRSFFDDLPTAGADPFPYTVLTPTFKGIYRKPENEKLVCATRTHIHVLASIGGQVVSTSYPLGSISCLETGVILLYSWITLYGSPDVGTCAATTFRFNSVTDQVMAPIIRSIRCAIPSQGGLHPFVMTDMFSDLAEANLKFRNYASRSILPGEQVLQTIYEPAIQTTLFRAFGLSLTSTLSPAHLHILTDRELIILSDDHSQAWLSSSPHGAIWQYIPLGQISRASLEVRGKDWLALCIQLQGNLLLESRFRFASRSNLEQLEGQLNVR